MPRRSRSFGHPNDARPDIQRCVNVAGKTNNVVALLQVNNPKSGVDSRLFNVFVMNVCKAIIYSLIG